jgi:Fe2+ or Zn2+ uptake regulation protein
MSFQSLVSAMEERRYKLTGPRLKLLATVMERGHSFTAEELYAELPDVGRATVFRTLKLLLELGSICKLNMDDGTPVYRRGTSAHHHHMVCTSCGRVQDFARCDIDSMLRRLAGATGFKASAHRIEVYGLCRTCQARKVKEEKL